MRLSSECPCVFWLSMCPCLWDLPLIRLAPGVCVAKGLAFDNLRFNIGSAGWGILRLLGAVTAVLGLHPAIRTSPMKSTTSIRPIPHRRTQPMKRHVIQMNAIVILNLMYCQLFHNPDWAGSYVMARRYFQRRNQKPLADSNSFGGCHAHYDRLL
jgi:hypothetical protein